MSGNHIASLAIAKVPARWRIELRSCVFTGTEIMNSAPPHVTALIKRLVGSLGAKDS